VVLYALTLGADIGVDIERRRAIPDAEELANRFFAPAEARTLSRLQNEERDEAFLLCWTRKEAYVKARGVGLSEPLDAFEVSLDRSAGSESLRIPRAGGQAFNWSLREIDPRSGYIATIAVAMRQPVLLCREWVVEACSPHQAH
jgi:4'-phosphopantetheinyl transferase